MTNIKTHLNNIKGALYGKDVRNSIHDAIEQCYTDASINGNSNMEVTQARGEYETLGKRLDDHASQLEHKANKTETKNIQTQINNLVLGAVGDGNNAEVIQARGEFDTLNDRIIATELDIIDGEQGFDGTVFETIGDNIRRQYFDIIEPIANLWTHGLYSQSYISGSTWKYDEFDLTYVINQGVTYCLEVHKIKKFVNANLGAILAVDASGKELYKLTLEKRELVPQEFTIPLNNTIKKILLRFQPVVGDPATESAIASVSGIRIYECGTKKLKDDITIRRVEEINDKINIIESNINSTDSKIEKHIVDAFEYDTLNLFNKNAIIEGYYMQGEQMIANSQFFITEYIPIISGAKLCANAQLRVVTFYDENKQYLGSVEFKKELTIDSNATYVVISMPISYLNSDVMINMGDSVKEYSEFNSVIKAKGMAPLENDISKIKKMVDASFTPYSNNLLDMTAITLNSYFDTAGTLGQNANYFVSDCIPVTVGDTIHANQQMRFVTFFNNKGNMIQHLSSIKSALVPDGADYVRITFASNLIDADIMVNTGTEPLPFKEYSEVVEPISLSGLEQRMDENESLINESISFIQNIFDPSPNLANPAKFQEGVYVDENGKITANSTYFITNIIPVQPGQIIRCNQYSRFISLYGADGQYLRWHSQYVAGGTPYTVEEDVFGVVYSIRLTEKDTAMVYLGEKTLDYIPYTLYSLKEESLPTSITDYQAKSLYGSEGITVSRDSLDANTKLTIDDFPRHLKKSVSLTFACTFNEFTNLSIGKGYNEYRGDWLKITSTTIEWQRYESSMTSMGSIEHGLTISDFLMLTMHIDENSKCWIELCTLSGSFSTSFKFLYECNYAPFVLSSNVLYDVKFSATSQDFRKPVWMFGDSYFGVAENRVIGQLKNLGFFNFLVNGLAGQTSSGAYSDLQRCLAFGTPKFLIWCLGMNDNDSNYKDILASLIALCEDKHITLILMKIPTVPSRSKEILNECVINSGCRYVDAYKAVGATSTGAWYNGYLANDNLHPNPSGARAIATRILVDIPEILQYGRTASTDELGDIGGDL